MKSDYKLQKGIDDSLYLFNQTTEERFFIVNDLTVDSAIALFKDKSLVIKTFTTKSGHACASLDKYTTLA